jgi:molybdate transport system substrate-binding protein
MARSMSGSLGVAAIGLGIVIAFQALSMSCTSGPDEDERSIMVGAGAGLKPVLDPVGEAFTEKTGIRVDYSYLCAAMVLTNMRLTKTGDVMVPGSQYYLDLAIEMGVIDPNTVAVAGYQIPVIAVQKGNPKNITCLEDLARPGITVGVGEKDALAVGRLTVMMLGNLGIYDEVMKNVQFEGGTATKLIMPVAMGNLDAVINWMPVAMAWEETVDFIKIDPEKLMYSIAPIGMTTYSQKKDLGRQYLDFVMSDEGRAIFERCGYAPYFDPEKIEKVR